MLLVRKDKPVDSRMLNTVQSMCLSDVTVTHSDIKQDQKWDVWHKREHRRIRHLFYYLSETSAFKRRSTAGFFSSSDITLEMTVHANVACERKQSCPCGPLWNLPSETLCKVLPILLQPTCCLPRQGLGVNLQVKRWESCLNKYRFRVWMSQSNEFRLSDTSSSQTCVSIHQSKS